MSEILIVKGTGSRSAEDVLKAQGYQIISSWVDGNLFERDGTRYRIGHPVWAGNDVRLEKVEAQS